MRILTKNDVDLALAATKVVLSMNFIDRRDFLEVFKEDFNLRGECEKTLNLLENLKYWMEKADEV